jgi:hypothetical protein
MYNYGHSLKNKSAKVPWHTVWGLKKWAWIM